MPHPKLCGSNMTAQDARLISGFAPAAKYSRVIDKVFKKIHRAAKKGKTMVDISVRGMFVVRMKQLLTDRGFDVFPDLGNPSPQDALYSLTVRWDRVTAPAPPTTGSSIQKG